MIDQSNLQFQYILDVLENTDQSIAISARAGAGKTTLINHWTSVTKKSYIKLAPTGLSALLMGGVTTNSLCHIPWEIILPNDPRLESPEIYKFFRLPPWKKDTLRNVDVIVIDECSMVQTFHLTILMRLLKAYRRNNPLPQFLFSFDAYQLGAVVKKNDWKILKKHYDTPYFFSSDLYKEVNPKLIELDKVYRQTDKKFVEVLSRIRLAEHTQKDIKYLNKKYQPEVNLAGYVRGMTHKWQVKKFNDEKYNALTGVEKVFTARSDGKLPKDKPVPEILKLKVGASVKLCINDPDKQYVNGTRGVVKSFGEDTVLVTIDGLNVRVCKHTWVNNNHKVTNDGELVTTKVGQYAQLPIKLYYASTVHSLQGSTIDKLALDLSGVFAPHQGYVGISRVTSYEGLQLLEPLCMGSFSVDPIIKKFKQKSISMKKVKKYFKQKYGDNWEELLTTKPL